MMACYQSVNAKAECVALNFPNVDSVTIFLQLQVPGVFIPPSATWHRQNIPDATNGDCDRMLEKSVC